MDNNILEREKRFHEQRFSSDEGRRKEDKFYVALHNMKIAFHDSIGMFAPKADVLDYGCGSGEMAIGLFKSAGVKSLSAIDISEKAISLAQSRATQEGVTIEFSTDDCEQTKFADGKFDLVYGSGILHHLNLTRSINEIKRITKSDGKAVFYEPLGTNPLIRLYRALTPNSRSEDEHPFMPNDLKAIGAAFPGAKFYFFGFFTLLSIPFAANPNTSRMYKICSYVDTLILRGPARWLAWSVLIVAKKKS